MAEVGLRRVSKSELRVAQRIGGAGPVPQFLVNALEQRSHYIIINIPKSPDYVSCAGGEKGTSDAGHPFDMFRITPNGSTSRKDHQWRVLKMERCDCGGIEIAGIGGAVAGRMKRSNRIKRIRIGVTGIVNEAASPRRGNEARSRRPLSRQESRRRVHRGDLFRFTRCIL